MLEPERYGPQTPSQSNTTGKPNSLNRLLLPKPTAFELSKMDTVFLHQIAGLPTSLRSQAQRGSRGCSSRVCVISSWPGTPHQSAHRLRRGNIYVVTRGSPPSPFPMWTPSRPDSSSPVTSSYCCLIFTLQLPFASPLVVLR